jgi:hypothetical protein
MRQETDGAKTKQTFADADRKRHADQGLVFETAYHPIPNCDDSEYAEGREI